MALAEAMEVELPPEQGGLRRRLPLSVYRRLRVSVPEAAPAQPRLDALGEPELLTVAQLLSRGPDLASSLPCPDARAPDDELQEEASLSLRPLTLSEEEDEERCEPMDSEPLVFTPEGPPRLRDVEDILTECRDETLRLAKELGAVPDRDLPTTTALTKMLRNKDLADAEVAACFRRLNEVLRFVMSCMRDPQPLQVVKLKCLFEALGVKSATGPPKSGKVGPYCNRILSDFGDWLTHNGGVPGLRKRLAALLFRRGEEQFPQGVRTPAHGGRSEYEPLQALTWLRKLCCTAVEEATEVVACLEALEQCIGDYPEAGKHAHAWLNYAILSSAPFQRRVLQLCKAPELDDSQLRAATADFNSAVLIEAGPGAGKTKTIRARCARLMAKLCVTRDLHMRCEDIVAVTFTRRSQADILEKLERQQLPLPTVLTIDSFIQSFIKEVTRHAGIHITWLSTTQCENEGKAEAPYSLEELLLIVMQRHCPGEEREQRAKLARELLFSAQTVYRQHGAFLCCEPSDELVRRLAADIVGEGSSHKKVLCSALPSLLQSGNVVAIGELKKLMGSLAAEISREAQTTTNRVSVARGYDKELIVRQLLHPQTTMPGAPSWTHRPRVQAAAVAVRALHAREYYVVDEFQDTSPQQLAVFTALAGGTRLTVVGDSDQSIYGFRGSQYETLKLAFAQQCPGFLEFKLGYNYRSTVHIVGACRALITPNYPPRSQPRRLQAIRTGGLPVAVVHCSVAAQAYVHVLQQVRGWSAAGVALERIAVLFRGKAALEAFRMYLREQRFSAFAELADVSAVGGGAAGSPVGIALGTIHAAKGLEWDLVYVVGACEEKRKTASALEVAEERRVLYVAMSRPAYLLHVVCTDTKSAFVQDILTARGVGHVHLMAQPESTFNIAELYCRC